MAALNYLSGGEAITPAAMNSLFAEFDRRLGLLLGGRSFAVAFKNVVWPGLLGKCFFFTNGLTAYSTRFPGYVTQNYTIQDPVLGPGQTVAGVRPYSHAPFTALASAATIASFDTSYRIAKIADIPQASYPSGLTKMSGVSVFDHSLEAHKRTLQAPTDTEPHTYYLQENEASPGQGGAVFPEKKYAYAVAEIVVEGVPRVEIPATWDKYSCFRVHNLQPTTLTFVLSGTEFTISPYGCRCFRRSVDGTNPREGLKYFFTFENNDYRMFWYWATIPKFRSDETGERDGTCRTAASAMQGNNLSNPAVLYDFIYQLTQSDKSILNGWFLKNNHEWCDIYSRVSAIRNYFADPGQAGTLLGDLLFHKGKLKIARTSKTPNAQGVRAITFDEVEFKGFATIVDDFAAKQLTVSENSAGNLTIANADSANDVELITWTTNLLHQPGYGGTGNEQIVRSAVSLRTPFEITPAVFESVLGDFPNQDPDGILGFTRRDHSNYRLPTKTGSASTSQSFRFYATQNSPTDLTATLPGVLAESVPSSPRTISGVHKVKVSDLLTLKYFAGNSSASSADDAFSTYTNARCVLTPSGLVVLFNEEVTAQSYLGGQTTTGYKGRFSARDYEFNGTNYIAKHCVRYRKHGWGFGELGKDNAAFFPVHTARCAVSGYQNDDKGFDGADFSAGDQKASVSPIRFLRQIGSQEVLTPPNRRFATIGQVQSLDGLDALSANLSEEFYRAKQGLIANDNSSKPRSVNDGRTFAMPLSVEHYNGMAQAVNQLQDGRPITQTSLRIPYGAKVLDFGDPTNSSGGLWIGTNKIGTGISTTTGQPETIGPAPYEFYGCLIDNGTDGLGRWWKLWLESKSVVIKTENDLPKWTTYKDVTRQAVQIKARNLTYHSNVRVEGNFIIGDVNAEVSLDKTYADVDTLGYVDNADGASYTVRPSDYVGVRWVTIAQIKALVEVFGFNFWHSENVVPLDVGVFQLPELENVPGVDQSPALVIQNQNLSASLIGLTEQQVQTALNNVRNYREDYLFRLPMAVSTVGVLTNTPTPMAPDFAPPAGLAETILNRAVIFFQSATPTYKSISAAVGITGRSIYKESWREQGTCDTASYGPTRLGYSHLGVIYHTKLQLQKNGALAGQSQLDIGYWNAPNWGEDWADVDRLDLGRDYTWQKRTQPRLIQRFQRDTTNPAVDGFYAFMNRERRMMVVRVDVSTGLSFRKAGAKIPTARVELSSPFMSDSPAGFKAAMARASFTNQTNRIGPHTIKQSTPAAITIQPGDNLFPTENDECFALMLDPTPTVALA